MDARRHSVPVCRRLDLRLVCLSHRQRRHRMNWATIIVLLVVLAMVIVAIRALQAGKGSCSCGENCKKDEKSSGYAGCSVDCPFRR